MNIITEYIEIKVINLYFNKFHISEENEGMVILSQIHTIMIKET
jgi:hypothetical protein